MWLVARALLLALPRGRPRWSSTLPLRPEQLQHELNLCCRHGDLARATRLVGEATAGGLAPSLALLQPLLYLHDLHGQWQPAVALLREAEARGLLPAERSYSTVVRACARAGRVPEALAVFDAMKTSNTAAHARTFQAVWCAGRVGRHARACRV